jgi:hypothetical protein
MFCQGTQLTILSCYTLDHTEGPSPLTPYHHLSMYRNHQHHLNGLGSDLLHSLVVLAQCNSRVLAPSR